MEMSRNPAGTYRIQFHKEFSFDAFIKKIHYFKKLGVQTIYASPIFQSVPGSLHGYDGTNPLQINTEIGSLEEFETIIRQLRENGTGWLQDIVPNHMAFYSQNQWLMDVLEKGKHSAFASYFDIDWNNEFFHGKLMVPFLGSSLADVLQKNELQLVFEHGRLFLRYYDNSYPVTPNAYAFILSLSTGDMPDELAELVPSIEQLEQFSDAATYAEHWQNLVLHFDRAQNDGAIREFIKQRLQQINFNTDLLQKIVDMQNYVPCHWQQTETKINYRRFFTVNGLICVNIQDGNVFNAYHQLIRQLMERGLITGLRVDHIDGLYDPAQYLERLQKLAGDDPYIVVEKILQAGESLPYKWKTAGTTGYDFLYLVNNLFTNKGAEGKFTNYYNELVAETSSIEDEQLRKKRFILYHRMAGELENLYQLIVGILDKELLMTVDPGDLKNAIAEFLIHCPVYRYYATEIPFEEQDEMVLKKVLATIRRKNGLNMAGLDLLEKIFFELPGLGNEGLKTGLLHFYKRCMQFTGPLMAKGVEDTLMYTYNRFIAHNDVGDSPAAFGIAKNEFHEAMIARQKHWPLSMNTTSTHDTKRGEDVRARLNVLSDMPEEWFQHVKEWQKMNGPIKENNAPGDNEEYFMYQNLVGAYPMPGTDDKHFPARFNEYLVKALREAKTNSDWAKPNGEYERNVLCFAESLLQKDSEFFKSFESFLKKIIDFGIIQSLAQLLLKFTCPGVPDVYQGCELWDLSFVDPDNRRPVDFDDRLRMLIEVEGFANTKNLTSSLWQTRHNGQIKLWLTRSLFNIRGRLPAFFARAEYIPLEVAGEFADFIFAFARRKGKNWLVTVIPLHTAELCRRQQKENIFQVGWNGTRIIPEPGMPGQARNILVDQEVENSFDIAGLLNDLPIALLEM